MSEMNWNTKMLAKQSDKNGNFENYIFHELLKEKKDLKVLDIGCSDGYNTMKRFSEYESIVKVTGIDISKNAIDKAESKNVDNRFEFMHMDIFDYKETISFDVIYLSYVLHHLIDPKSVLEKAHQLLSASGLLIIKTTDDDSKLSYPDEYGVTKRIMEFYDKEIRQHNKITENTDRYNGKKCFSLLKNSGFKNIDFHYEITDTVNKTEDERLEIFESYFHFRNRYESDLISSDTRELMNQLVQSQKELFSRDDYYFSSTTYLIVARKEI